MPFTDQREYRVRFECGERGLVALSEGQPMHYVIVDVLSFSTCVVIGVERAATILPYRWKDASAEAYASEHGALLAGAPGSPYSLVAESLASIPPGTRLCLPSPNGSTLAFAAAPYGAVLVGAPRNRNAISAYLEKRAGTCAIIAAGERWPDGTLRPCLEDVIGAGAIIAGLSGSRSPEAAAAAAVYAAASSCIHETLTHCSSGRELFERGHPRNVELAAEVDAANCVPILRDGCLVAADPG